MSPPKPAVELIALPTLNGTPMPMYTRTLRRCGTAMRSSATLVSTCTDALYQYSSGFGGLSALGGATGLLPPGRLRRRRPDPALHGRSNTRSRP